ncbi:MAG: hypothetical protein QOE59_5311 [Actinomycetota bacterium]|jgi:hypothetical protein|nr:hypothetical protein [Actinomycetota bacterium]
MRTRPEELVLAFDADCHRCRTVAGAVRAREPGLEVLPLRDYRVAAWRREALGDDPPHTPTLLAVTVASDGTDRVRAWTGPAVVAGLVATLGVRRTAALAPVLRTLVRTALVRTPSPGRGA